MERIASIMRNLFRAYIVENYKTQITNENGDITRTCIKDYIKKLAEKDPAGFGALKEICGGHWDPEEADSFKSWEQFLKIPAKDIQPSKRILQAMCIAFKVPGYEKLDSTGATDHSEITNDTPAYKYYIGYFFSDQYELKSFLLEIFADHTVNLYYIEKEESRKPKKKGRKEFVIKNQKHEYYSGKIEGHRAITLTKGNQYSQIILSASYLALSDDCKQRGVCHSISGLWIKDHFRKATYESASWLIMKKIKDNEISTIKKAQISQDEILEISGWRYDKLPYKFNCENIVPNLLSPLTNLPGKYEIYECLTNGKEFSRFILDISDNLELSLHLPKHNDSGKKKSGYLKLHPLKETIILLFPSVEWDTAETDSIFIILQIPPGYSDTKNVLTGCICETNKGKPFCGGVYVKKLSDQVKDTESKRIKLGDIIREIRNNEEYPHFFDFFLGKIPDKRCIISQQAYNKLHDELKPKGDRQQG